MRIELSLESIEAINYALSNDYRTNGVNLDWIGQALGVPRRLRPWWFDEGDDSYRRRLRLKLLADYQIVDFQFIKKEK